MTPSTPNSSGDSARRPPLLPLTSLRFVAAMVVVLFHTWWQFPGVALLRAPAAVENLISAGHLGVSVFFILSGFILAWNYLGSDFSQREARRQFWLARFARIYPVYLLGVLVATPKYFSTLLAGTPSPGAAMAEAAGAALAVTTLTQAWIPQLALAWNPPGWSLSAELFFYLAFPFIAMRLPVPRRTSVVIGGLVVCWLAMLLPAALCLAVQPAPIWLPVLKFNPLVRLPEFAMGILLGRLFLDRSQGQHRAPSATSTIVLTLAGGATIGMLASIDQRSIYLLLHNGLLDPLFCVLIFSLADISLQASRFNRFLSNRALVLLGEASYALYLLHLPLKGLVQAAARRVPGLNVDEPLTSLAIYVAYLAGSITAAILTFKALESPARRWIKRLFSRRNAVHRTTASSTPVPSMGIARGQLRPVLESPRQP